MEADIIKQFRTITWILILVCGTFFGISFQTNPDEIYSETLIELKALEALNYDQYCNSLEEGYPGFKGVYSSDDSFIKHLNEVLNKKCIQECKAIPINKAKTIHISNNGLSYPIKFNLPSAQSKIEQIHSFLINPQEIHFYYPRLDQIVNFIFEKRITSKILANSSDTIHISSLELVGQVDEWNTSENQFLKRRIEKDVEKFHQHGISFNPFTQSGVFFKKTGLKTLNEDSNPIPIALKIYGNGNSKTLVYSSLMWSEISDLTVFEAINLINNKIVFDSGDISVLGFSLPRTPISIFIILLFFGLQFYLLACILEVKHVFLTKSLQLKSAVCLPFMGNTIGNILTFLLFFIIPILTLIFWNMQSKFYSDEISYVIIIIYAILSFITYIKLVKLRKRILLNE